ncbi:hypothetical protein NT6N_23830 [Oceaniferula spumae]|uniref:Lipoprotein n=1 Tax=Oceaniferula spumae TaxID=2979115 RepID=A0AAT9FMZ1_9BACT
MNNNIIRTVLGCVALLTIGCHERQEPERTAPKEVNIKMHKWIGKEVHIEFTNEILVKELEGQLKKRSSLTCILNDVDEDVLYLLYENSIYWIDAWNIKAVRLNKETEQGASSDAIPSVSQKPLRAKIVNGGESVLQCAVELYVRQ